MKSLSSYLSIGLIALSCHTQAAAGDDSTGLNNPILQLPIDAAFTYFPTSDQADYKLMSGKAGGSANLTCSGVSLQGSLESMIANYQAMAGQTVANAPAIAINYLAYSRPTMYALVQNLKESFEMNLGASNTACQIARSAGKKNWSDNPDQQRAEDCFNENGGLAPSCVGTKPEQYVSSFLDKKREWSDRIQEAIDGMNDFLSTDCESLDAEEPTLLSYVLAKGPNQCKDVSSAKDILIDLSIDPEKGEMTPIPPEKTFTAELKDRAVNYKDLLTTIAGEDTASLDQSAAFQDLSETNRVRFSYSDQRLLQQMKQQDPRKFEVFVQRMASLYAINDLEDLAYRLKIGLRQGALNSNSAEIGNSNAEHIRKQADDLLEYTASQRKRLENQQMEADFLRQGYKILNANGRN